MNTFLADHFIPVHLTQVRVDLKGLVCRLRRASCQRWIIIFRSIISSVCFISYSHPHQTPTELFVCTPPPLSLVISDALREKMNNYLLFPSLFFLSTVG